MTYAIEWSPRSVKELAKLEKPLSKRILQKILEIRETPEQYLKRLTDDPRWSLRVGDYRILVNLNVSEQKIQILTLGHRKNIYDR